MNLKGRHFLKCSDFSKIELEYLLDLADELKLKQKGGVEHSLLKGKSLAMLFDKPSNRTRLSFEVGISQLGGQGLYIKGEEVGLGVRESVADVARVFSRYVNGIMIRTFAHESVVELAKYSGVPVINGLTDQHHPCQALADIMTIREKRKSLAGTRVCFLGDGNNVCYSLVEMCTIFEMPITVCTPKGYELKQPIDQKWVTFSNSPEESVVGVDVVYTDVWVSMGQEAQSEVKIKAFKGFTVNDKLMSLADKEAIFMHCLPAHRGFEVEDSVIESGKSVVFDEAENRLHAQKALMAAVM